MLSKTINCYKLVLFTCLFFLLATPCFLNAQQQNNSPNRYRLNAITDKKTDLFGTQGSYIQNIGQYGDTLAGFANMGQILYGYEGLSMPVLFTAKGVIHLQKQQQQLTYEERSAMINAGMSKEQRKKITEPCYRNISFEWLNANPNPEIIAQGKQTSYHTYGTIKQKAYAFEKLVYKNLYPGIDAEYSFEGADRPGYEFKLLVNAGADINKIKIRFAGDIQSVTTDEAGRLVVKSDIDGIIQSVPLCYFSGEEMKASKQRGAYSVHLNEIEFKLPEGFTAERSFVIDPFVTSTATLTGGSQSGVAKDIDFDYDGNIFVTGGGDGTIHKLAKFSPAGVLLWTFSGTLTSPVWNFGGSYGGWVVEKGSGAVYLGQGLASSGFSVVRLNSAGIYDNYISTPNTNFTENWRMTYSCNGGTPRILIAGGGGNANNELAILDPSTVTPATSNLSGLTGGHNDISDIILDPVTNEMYTIYSTPVTDATRDNLIFKHAPPYNSTTRLWQANAGFFSLREPFNRPYINGLDNSTNSLAVNANYLFYWDGLNLKAFSKATGLQVGAVTTFTGNIALRTGGIFADQCNNVFIGFTNGIIKVLNFNGSIFNDGAVADISIPGFAASNIFDIVYDNGQQLLYASGNGFLASLDISSYCPATIYNISHTEDCAAGTIQASITPLPIAGTTIEYELWQGTTLLNANSTGSFSGLIIGESYTVKVFLNRLCGGTHANEDFIFYDSPLLTITNPAAVCPIVGLTSISDPAVTAGSAPGYTYSYWMDLPATNPVPNPASVSAGTYYIKATPLTGTCYIIKKVVVPARVSPIADAGRDTIICFGKDIQLNGANGISYSWSPSTYLNSTTIQNPVMINPQPGTYTYSLHVVDAGGCRSINADQVTIRVNSPLRVRLVSDTVIAINQPLQLNAVDVDNSGFNTFLWTPSFGLSDPFIKDPVAILDRDMIYQVIATTPDDCKGTAVISIKVYKGPEIYVPSAFTPDGDGLNDIMRPVVVGMKEFHYFKIFNRWGQMVFSSANPNAGWNGKISGIEQGTATFVWIAEAVDFNGNLVKRKGTVTLIR
jgi:gliding motility-associated-like protein